jgi:threonine-phosphate decarboxylase
MLNRIHGGDCPKPGIIDFSININPLGLPRGLSGAILKNADCILRYPEPSAWRLKVKLAALHSIKPGNIAIGNGSIELIYIIPRACKIRKAVIATPTFSEYEFALRSNGSNPVFINADEQEDFRLNCLKLGASLPRADAFFLCNPNNPTGSLLHNDEVMHLARSCKRQGAVLILDEAFIEFAKEANRAETISESVEKGSMVILRSLTKCFAIPGLRLGYAIGHEKIIDMIARLQYPWNVNGLAQLAGEKAIADKSYMERTRMLVVKERQYIFKGLNSIKGLKIYPSLTNFLLCKLHDAPIKSAGELARRLLRHGICIRDCSNFRGLNDAFFRVAVRKREENNRLINSIKKALQ